jgi:hypothetical protein
LVCYSRASRPCGPGERWPVDALAPFGSPCFGPSLTACSVGARVGRGRTRAQGSRPLGLRHPCLYTRPDSWETREAWAVTRCSVCRSNPNELCSSFVDGARADKVVPRVLRRGLPGGGGGGGGWGVGGGGEGEGAFASNVILHYALPSTETFGVCHMTAESQCRCARVAVTDRGLKSPCPTKSPFEWDCREQHRLHTCEGTAG